METGGRPFISSYLDPPEKHYVFSHDSGYAGSKPFIHFHDKHIWQYLFKCKESSAILAVIYWSAFDTNSSCTYGIS